MSQVSIRVFMKHNGFISTCPVKQAEDGVAWLCPRCRNVVIRVSFGMMNGVLHCACGAEVELIVDGQIVDIADLNVMGGRPPQNSLAAQIYTDPNTGEHHVDTPAPAVDDESFLRGCGILMEEEK